MTSAMSPGPSRAGNLCAELAHEVCVLEAALAGADALVRAHAARIGNLLLVQQTLVSALLTVPPTPAVQEALAFVRHQRERTTP